VLADWGQYSAVRDTRVICGPCRHVNHLTIYATAVQRRDGSIDRSEPPTINIDDSAELGRFEACQLAEYLMAAADQIDRWVNNPASSVVADSSPVVHAPIEVWGAEPIDELITHQLSEVVCGPVTACVIGHIERDVDCVDSGADCWKIWHETDLNINTTGHTSEHDAWRAHSHDRDAVMAEAQSIIGRYAP
jgi:hypothetical protein